MIDSESEIGEKGPALVVVHFDRDAGREGWRLQFFVLLHFHALQAVKKQINNLEKV